MTKAVPCWEKEQYISMLVNPFTKTPFTLKAKAVESVEVYKELDLVFKRLKKNRFL